jgi:two-component system, OmpR family, sensor histidine kinase KdpD
VAAEVRAKPEDFLELVRRTKRGRLRLFLGFAAGVGKTYRMLEEAHTLKARGVDVVLAYVEPHGRPETAALAEGLETIPRKKVEYRGVAIEELDLEAVLVRRPEVAIVDEVAHTNAPGSKNRKRWKDVLDILDEGINVLAAFNIQHLESLNDLVERVTGVRVRETVPDSFLRHADQVINLDMPAEDLLERLRAGKVYAPEKIEWALAHFFKDRNLQTLRELALREVAEAVELGLASRSKAAAFRTGSRRRVCVCMSSSPPQGAALLRRGSRLAGRLDTSWFALYVQTPSEAPERIDAEVQRQLLANTETARELGAEVVHLRARDPVTAILDFARSHNVGVLMIGRSQQPWWKRVFGRSIPIRLVDEGWGLDIQIVSLDQDEEASS